MLFNSLAFLIFFPIVLIIYFLIPKKIKHFWLLIASYYFYMSWNAKYALLIFASTVITYLGGILIERVKQKKWDEKKRIQVKKFVVAGCFIINLGILFYFKYFNFAIDLVARAFARIHIQVNTPVFDIVLPVGISFYTFQALSYTMDVYRDEIYAEKNFFRYALFVSFFSTISCRTDRKIKESVKAAGGAKAF